MKQARERGDLLLVLFAMCNFGAVAGSCTFGMIHKHCDIGFYCN